MTKVQVEYNPYVRETKVLFNGNKPRINSIVEKYKKYLLNDWINEVPIVFYNEMNGYDFDLEFIGTALDYKELKDSFSNNGITEDKVRFFHKNEFQSREDKLIKLQELFVWLTNNTNRKLDIEEFKANNIDMFEDSFPIVVVGSGIEESFKYDNVNIQVERLDTVNSLAGTDLEEVPIIICINPENCKNLNTTIHYINSRSDLKKEQIFFWISPMLNKDSISRKIIDLGVQIPLIVKGINDVVIKKYFEIHPLTTYLYESLNILREKKEEIRIILESENEEFEISNEEIVAKIRTYESRIENLKEAISFFNNIDNLNIPNEWKEIESDFIKIAMQWKPKKTLINGDEEANNMAQQFESDIANAYIKFKTAISGEVSKVRTDISRKCLEVFEDAIWDSSLIKTSMVKSNTVIAPNISDIKTGLLAFRNEHYEKAKSGFFENIFQNNSSEEKEDVLVVTYSCKAWRGYVETLISKCSKTYLDDCINELNRFYKENSEEYLKYLNDVLNTQIEMKNNLASQLSEDNAKLQQDNDWLVDFEDMIKAIERD